MDEPYVSRMAPTMVSMMASLVATICFGSVWLAMQVGGLPLALLCWGMGIFAALIALTAMAFVIANAYRLL